jgi:surface antigen
MFMRSVVAVLLVAVLLVPGCAPQQFRQEDAGMVIGGVLGGVLGTQIGGGRGQMAAIIAGTLVGAAVGGAVGRSMDDVDRMKTAQTLETVRTGVPAQWRNPDTGSQYTVVPTRTWETAAGPCREYTIDAMIGGRTEKVYGTACRQPDGSWQVQN